MILIHKEPKPISSIDSITKGQKLSLYVFQIGTPHRIGNAAKFYTNSLAKRLFDSNRKQMFTAGKI